MSAPSNTIWGNVIPNSSSSVQGKIGIARSWESFPTYAVVTIDVWFWSRYQISDSNNSYYYDDSTTPTLIGAKSISHTSSDSWSVKNQTLLGSYKYTYYRGTSTIKKTYSAKLTGIDNLGSSNVTSVTATLNLDPLESFTVSYDANGGINAPSSQTKWYGTNITLSSTKPTREGHTFLGWGTSSTDTSVDYASGGVYSANASIKLYAIWQRHTYEVWYDANGGINAPSGQTKLYGVTLPLQTAIPTRTNYNFLGWSPNKSATEPTYSSGGNYTNNASITLYAVWELAYVKPRISNLYVYRSDSLGIADETGTKASIKFDWATDKTNAGYQVYYKKVGEPESAYKGTRFVNLYDTSGSEQSVIATDSSVITFDTELSYDIKVNITDDFGYDSYHTTLNSLFIPIDSTPNGRCMSFGEPAKDTEDGVLRFAYDTIDIAPKEELLYHGKKLFGQSTLWSGSAVMDATHFIDLSKPISEMKHGIVLVFGRNSSYNLTPYFIPKESIIVAGRTTYAFPLLTSLFDYVGQKTLYVSDTKIEGHADNSKTGKNATSGITYHNEAFYLRYVYEV